MEKTQKVFDLEQRTFKFAQEIRIFVKLLPRTVANMQDVPQLVRSSGSIGANYIEANESFSKKDYYMRVKISRKEAKETSYWLNLVDLGTDQKVKTEKEKLVREATELTHIFGSIISKAN